MMYIAGGKDESWMYDLFDKISFFALHRSKKYLSSPAYEDILQEAKLGLWIAIKTFDYKRNFDFYRWAQWSISSKIRNFLYEGKRHSSVSSSDDEVLTHLDPAQEDFVFVREILSESSILSDRESSVIYDILFMGKTLSETASPMSISPEAVRKIKNKAIFKLKNNLDYI